ncbi:efflux RND transporter periplasmic adaptor subunit [Thermosulfurimonas sp.]|uniref:efflux RND transporter periplasmic adaptor subunit n=1 Tax=Thermosulfurimonas sp. TaxID=2080236 RepID=UPI0025DED45C|nr:efflux RND transporter periplasmic adaptor subunit [Thermosulfurimonas sp.]
MKKIAWIVCFLGILGMSFHSALAGERQVGEKTVHLSPQILQEFEIRLERARLRSMPRVVELPAEVVVDPDRVVHVVPVVAGFVRQTLKRWGDRVRSGEVLAVLDSPELADLKSSYLIARTRLRLARELFLREKMLWEKKITSEESFLRAKQDLELARIQVQTLTQKLLTLGFSPENIGELENGKQPLGRYELRSPISGIVVEKHLSRGEMATPSRIAFQIADLSEVWVLVSVYRDWLPEVREGQKVQVDFGHGIPSREGRIDYINPILREDTRSARARIRLANPDGRLRPGLLARARIEIGRKKVLAVPESALQRLDGRTVIFVREKEGFVARPVKIGPREGGWVEILSGLSPGEIYVARGALTLRAELERENLGEGHSH